MLDELFKIAACKPFSGMTEYLFGSAKIEIVMRKRQTIGYITHDENSLDSVKNRTRVEQIKACICAAPSSAVTAQRLLHKEDLSQLWNKRSFAKCHPLFLEICQTIVA